jgi:hypothetical protein
MQERLSEGQDVVGRSGPLSRAGAAISGSAFQFESTDGDSEASLALTFDLDRYEPRETDSGLYRLSDLQLVVKAVVPIDQDSAIRKLLTGDTLVSGSRVSFAMTRSVSYQGDGRNSAAVVLPIYRACIIAKLENWPTSTVEERAKVQAYQTLVSPILSEVDISEFGNAIRRLARDNESDLSIAVRDGCVGKQPAEIADDLGEQGKDLKAAFESAVFINEPLRFMGLDATYGRRDFDVLDRAAFTVRDVGAGLIMAER